MTIHITFDRLIEEAQAGRTGAGDVLGYALTGLLSTIFPEFELGFHQLKAPDNYRKLFWNNLNGDEVCAASPCLVAARSCSRHTITAAMCGAVLPSPLSAR